MIRGGRLTTHRLEVRPFEEADAARLVAVFADPLVARYVGDGTSLDAETAAHWVRQSRLNLEIYGYGTGAVVERATGGMIGWAGVALPEGMPEEIIYGFARAAWGRGHGSELVPALADFAAARGLDPVRATVDPENHASARLLRRAGFLRAPDAAQTDPDAVLWLRHGTNAAT